jgi:hypothetical protein
MSALSTKQEESIDLFQSKTSDKNEESLEMSSKYRVNILSDLPSVIFVGRGFPLMAEVVDKDSNRPQVGEISFKVALLDNLGNEKIALGLVKTEQIAFFRKLVPSHEGKDLSLVVSAVVDDLEIASFCKKVTVKCRKSKDLTSKKKKSQEEIILNE